MENNVNLFSETASKLIEAFGSVESWKSGYTERLMKNILMMQLEPDKFPGFNETTCQALLQQYARRKVHLIVRDVIC